MLQNIVKNERGHRVLIHDMKYLLDQIVLRVIYDFYFWPIFIWKKFTEVVLRDLTSEECRIVLMLLGFDIAQKQVNAGTPAGYADRPAGQLLLG